jgi:hypothetical protein
MDPIDRMFRRLAAEARAKYPEYLSHPFAIEEIFQQIIPYRHFRRELGLDTNVEYETLLTRLLTGERGYLVTESDVREALRRELESPIPDTGAFRAFAERRVAFSPEALRKVDGADRARTPAAEIPSTATAPQPTPDSLSIAVAPVGEPEPRSSAGVLPEPTRMSSPTRSITASDVGGSCRYCGGTLPDGRRITFCPHCGQDLTVQQCPACGTELEIGWKYCTTCGRSVAPV